MHIGIFGLSGSGKTTLNKSFSAKHPEYFSTSASRVLKALGQDTQISTLTPTTLQKNQEILIKEYRKLQETNRNTLIELHTVIETNNSLFWIPKKTLTDLNLDLIFFLEADPKEIFKRRHNDKRKNRKTSSPEEILEIQQSALKYLQNIYGKNKVSILNQEKALEKIEKILASN